MQLKFQNEKVGQRCLRRQYVASGGDDFSSTLENTSSNAEFIQLLVSSSGVTCTPKRRKNINPTASKRARLSDVPVTDPPTPEVEGDASMEKYRPKCGKLF